MAAENELYQTGCNELMLRQLHIMNSKEESSAASPYLFTLIALALSDVANTPTAHTTIQTAFGLETPLLVEFMKRNWPKVSSMDFKGYLLGGIGNAFPFPHSLAENVDFIERSGAQAMEAKLLKEMGISHKVPAGDCVIAVFSALSDQFMIQGDKFEVPFYDKMVDGVKMPALPYNILSSEAINAVQLPMRKGSTLFLIQLRNPNNYSQVLQAVQSDAWIKYNASVTFPKFKLESNDNLIELLKPTTPGKPSLKNMSTSQGRVQSIQASCEFHLDEKGVEAKAAATISFTRGGGGARPLNIGFTEEFWAVIVDDSTNQILFVALYGRGMRPQHYVDSMEFLQVDLEKIICPQEFLKVIGSYTIKFGITARLHDGKDDEEGSAVHETDIIRTDEGINYRIPVEELPCQFSLFIENLSSMPIHIRPVYVDETEDEDPGEISLLIPRRGLKLDPLQVQEDEEIQYYEIKDPDLATTFLKVGIIAGKQKKRRIGMPNHGMDFGNPFLVTLEDTMITPQHTPNAYFVSNL